MIELVSVARGARFRIFAVGVRNDEGKMTLPYLELRELLAYMDPADMIRLDRVLERAADHGPGFSSGQAKRLRDVDLYEFRTRRGTRLFWIYGAQQTILCLSGYVKQSTNTPKGEIIRAELWRRLYLRWRKFQENENNNRSKGK